MGDVDDGGEGSISDASEWIWSADDLRKWDQKIDVFCRLTVPCGSAGPPVDGMASVSGRPDGAEEDVGNGNMYLTSSDYGGYQEVLAIHAEGSLEAEKMQIFRAFSENGNAARVVGLASRMAGLSA